MLFVLHRANLFERLRVPAVQCGSSVTPATHVLVASLVRNYVPLKYFLKRLVVLQLTQVRCSLRRRPSNPDFVVSELL